MTTEEASAATCTGEEKKEKEKTITYCGSGLVTHATRSVHSVARFKGEKTHRKPFMRRTLSSDLSGAVCHVGRMEATMDIHMTAALAAATDRQTDRHLLHPPTRIKQCGQKGGEVAEW